MTILIEGGGALAADEQAAWPPRALLVRALVDGIQPILDSQDPTSGRFGTQPWVCNDQNVLFPLAAAWAIEDPANPWYHDETLLRAICRGGEALVDAQDEGGMWEFRKKDNSTWGPLHMPWTYSRWIRAFWLVRDAMPPQSRAKWERGLLLGFTGIRAYMDGGLQNIPCHHAMGLYIAGICFGNEEWKQAAAVYQARIVAAQDPAGFWSEHFGPVVGYNAVYIDALGIYYSFSKDPIVLEALARAARFHASVLLPDGSAVPSIDERQIYHAGADLGNPGFAWTPEGRGYLLHQTRAYRAADTPFGGPDYAAAMLLFGGEGEGLALGVDTDRSTTALGDNDALIERDKPWQFCLSGYACAPVDNRWIQDRQNLVDVYHDALGLVIGGGNTKMQPYWSTFTVGDPSLLRHTPGDESPDFTPRIDLQWTPERASLDVPARRLELAYGPVNCAVTVETHGDGALALTYSVTKAAGEQVEAHVPILRRTGDVTFATERTLTPGEDEVVLTCEETGEWLEWDGLRVTIPPGGSLRWPARQHDPYTKDGRSPLDAAKLVLVLPFGEGAEEKTVVVSSRRQR